MTAGVVVCQSSLIDEARTVPARSASRARSAEQALAQADAPAMPGLRKRQRMPSWRAPGMLENLANAFEHCHRAIADGACNRDKRVQSCATLSSIFHRTGDCAEALEHFDHCIELAGEAGDTQDELAGSATARGRGVDGNASNALELLGAPRRAARSLGHPNALGGA